MKVSAVRADLSAAADQYGQQESKQGSHCAGGTVQRDGASLP